MSCCPRFYIMHDDLRPHASMDELNPCTQKIAQRRKLPSMASHAVSRWRIWLLEAAIPSRPLRSEADRMAWLRVKRPLRSRQPGSSGVCRLGSVRVRSWRSSVSHGRGWLVFDRTAGFTCASNPAQCSWRHVEIGARMRRAVARFALALVFLAVLVLAVLARVAVSGKRGHLESRKDALLHLAWLTRYVTR